MVTAQQTTYKRGISWLAPDGTFWRAESHTVDAAFIARDVLGMEVDDIYFYKEDYADILVKLGWIKLTNTLLFDYYKEAGLYNKMTNEQSDSFEKWYTYHFEHREI